MDISLVSLEELGLEGRSLDISSFLSLDKPAAFVFKVGTNRFAGEGIFPGDFVVLRRDLEPYGDQLVAVERGEEDFVLQRLSSIKEAKSEREWMRYRLVGVVTAVFRRVPLKSR